MRTTAVNMLVSVVHRARWLCGTQLTRLFTQLSATCQNPHVQWQYTQQMKGTVMDWTTCDTPVGPLLIVATHHGVARIAFITNDDATRELHRTAGMLTLSDYTVPDTDTWRQGAGYAHQAATELSEYFTGKRHTFDVPLDRRLSRGFRLAALTSISTIPYGTTQSYGEVASAINNPNAVRAVGGACATNPIPIIVPCHRVVRADRSLGGYLGGQGTANLSYKITLLDLEKADHNGSHLTLIDSTPVTSG